MQQTDSSSGLSAGTSFTPALAEWYPTTEVSVSVATGSIALEFGTRTHNSFHIGNTLFCHTFLTAYTSGSAASHTSSPPISRVLMVAVLPFRSNLVGVHKAGSVIQPPCRNGRTIVIDGFLAGKYQVVTRPVWLLRQFVTYKNYHDCRHLRMASSPQCQRCRIIGSASAVPTVTRCSTTEGSFLSVQ